MQQNVLIISSYIKPLVEDSEHQLDKHFSQCDRN